MLVPQVPFLDCTVTRNGVNSWLWNIHFTWASNNLNIKRSYSLYCIAGNDMNFI